MPLRESDRPWMQQAIELARQGRGQVEPNPLVGCVIVNHDRIVGSGFHQRFGGPHAEVEALANCADPESVQGATAYVTLEPCCHQGKTPPCTDALIQAGIARVVIAMEDPFPRVAGGGIAQLQRAGIQTDVGVLQSDAFELNAPYLKRVSTGVPWVIAKWAMTADGRIATSSGQSQWITGPAARREVHRLRGRMDAVAVGMGTVAADDPLLTARPPGARVATRVVFCQHRIPNPQSQLIRSAAAVPLLLVTSADWDQSAGRAALPELARLQQAGAEVLVCESDEPVGMVQEALAEFGRRDWTNLLVEGGSELLASFFSADQIDECHAYVGAKVFGGRAAPGPLAGQGVESIDHAMDLKLISIEQFGDDIRAVYRKLRPD